MIIPSPRRTSLAYLAAACLLAALAAWALVPRPADAHAILVRSDPPVNARLQDPPPLVSGFFSESLDTRLSSLKVIDGSGERVDSGQTSFGPEDTRMYTEIPQALPPGFYAVLWETLSSVDGHLLKGSYPFTVVNADGSEPSGPHPSAGGTAGYTGGSPKPDSVATKWTGLVAAMALVGSLAFAAWVAGPMTGAPAKAARRHLGRVAWPAVAVLAVVGAAELLLQARRLGGLDLTDEALRTVWGERWIERQAVLGALAAALFASDRLRRAGQKGPSDAFLWITLAGGLGYLLLVAMVSHGNAVPGSFWAVGADFLHLAAGAVWIGMLAQIVLFLVWLRNNVPEGNRAKLLAGSLQRFSAVAATSVAVLMATGAINGLSQVPDVEAMFDTAYGRTLTLKLGIMLALLVVAGVNAFFLRARAVEDGSDEQTRRLTTATRIEIGLGLAVLLAAAVLIQYPASRQERDAEANVQTTQVVVGYDELQDTGPAQVNLTISPKAVGNNSFRVYIFPPSDGSELGEIQRVRLRFKPPDPSQGPSQVIAEPIGFNGYKAVGPFFTNAGAWEVAVDIRRRDVEDVTALFRVAVPGAGPQEAGRFALPLAVGSWTTVAAAGVLLAAVLMVVWAAQWPGMPRRVRRVLRVSSGFVTVIGIAVLAESLFPGGEPASTNPVEATGTSISVGRSLYVENCARCHGAEGRGDGPDAPALTIPPADFRQHIPYHTDMFFFQVISNGLGDFMPPFADQITEEERWHLINFLKAEYSVDVQQSAQ